MPAPCTTAYDSLTHGLCRFELPSLFNSEHTHTLKTRDISVASASSFIIVVSVGFIGILVVCAGSSGWYRQRVARRGGAALPAQTTRQGPAVRPQLWDVYLPDLQTTSPGLQDSRSWERVLPLAMTVETEKPGDGAGVAAEKGARPASRWSRVAAWLRPWPPRGARPSRPAQSPSHIAQSPAQTAPSPPPAEPITIASAEVAVMIAMPCPQYSPRLSHAGDRPLSLDGQGLWTECAVGTSRIPYHGRTEDFESAAAS